LIALQIDQIVDPGGASKAPMAFGDRRIIPSTGAAAPQRVQQATIEVWPDCGWGRLRHQVRTNLKPIR
jgi:hypothetical protein